MRIPFAIPPRAQRAFDLVGMGENSVDMIAVLSGPPEPGSKQQIERFKRLPGGQVATAVVTCARLGWRTRYVGRFGDDDLGRESRESLLAEGIDVSAAPTITGSINRLAIILVDRSSGERTVLGYRDPVLLADAPGTRHLELAAVTTGRLLLVDADDVARSTFAARAAHHQGIPTIVDIEAVEAGTADLLRAIDVIIAAQEFPSALTGYPDIGRALEAIEQEYHPALVCATLGADGSLARCQGTEIRTPPFRVNCVDTTGAGDAFRGGFVAGCLEAPEGEVDRLLTYANAVAALNCQGLGARGGLPRRSQVATMLGL